MKRLLLIAAIMLLAMPAMAIDLTFSWDKVPDEEWDSVSIYERTGTSLFVYQKVLTTDGTLSTAKLTGASDRVHTYVARSVRGTLESADSNAVTYTPVAKVPTPPGMLKVTKTP